MIKQGLIFVVLSCSQMVAAPLETKWVQSLEDNKLSERKAAQSAIEKWVIENPTIAVEQLYLQYSTAVGPESKTRLLGILKDRVLLEKFGKERGFVGIRMDDTLVKLAGDTVFGVLVVEAVKGSPAEVVGLKPNDVIIGINGKRLGAGLKQGVFSASMRFGKIIGAKQAGDTVTLTIVRNGAEIKKQLTLAARPKELDPFDEGNSKVHQSAYFSQWLRSRSHSSR